MATKLKDLKITKVDFVDAGANPKANVLLYKNKDGKPGTQQGTQAEPEEPKREGMWKRFMSAIGKAVGLEPEEIDAAVDEIAKGNEAETFGEKMYEVKRRKITDEIWDLCYALQTSLCSIICDDEVKDNAQELMQTSLEQFSSTMSKSIGKWAVSYTHLDVYKRQLLYAVSKPYRFRREALYQGNMQSGCRQLGCRVHSLVDRSGYRLSDTGAKREDTLHGPY